MKTIITIILLLSLAGCSAAPATNESSPNVQESTVSSESELPKEESSEVVSNEDENITKINFSNNKVTLNNKELSTDKTSLVYLKTVVETHPDVEDEFKGTENQVVVITDKGDYSFSGEIENSQIVVDTLSEEQVNIILDNLTITNQTAPAILIKNANEMNTKGDGSVTITLKKDTKNTVSGGSIGEYTDESGETLKSGGAISSNVSIVFDGEGSLVVNAKNEGVESQKHLTINSGNLDINARDDSLNASEDGVSQITINGGYVYAKSILGEEGDGIDSNGSIIINGGTVIAIANEKSMDSGLDADISIEINGGIVVGTGAMYDKVSDGSRQNFLHLQGETIPKGSLVVVKDEIGTPVLAYKTLTDSSSIVLSNDMVAKNNQTIYIGGEIEGTKVNGLYTEITSYKDGVIFVNSSNEPGGQPPTKGTPPAKP